jgi:benzoate membrane transport protein
MTAKGWTITPVIAAMVAILAGYSGSVVIVFQAAAAAHLGPEQLSSWVWAISLGCGVTGVFLSLWHRAPISVAWSTPGAALLVVSLPNIAYPEAIGAFVLSAAAIVLLAVTGLFGRVMRLVPNAVASGMLAGILLRFGTDTFVSLGHAPLLVAVMLAVYFTARRLVPRFAVSLVLVAGVGLAVLRGQTDFSAVHLELAVPVFTWPRFSLFGAINLAIPLTLVAITGQYLPGLAVLRGAGYEVPPRGLISVIGGASLLLAPFGCHGITTAAITAALIAGPDGHEDPRERWRAGVAMGGLYLLIALFGATLAALFAALPKELIAAIAGLALLGAILGGLSNALATPGERDAAMITFLCTASGMSLFGLGAAFWGLVLGLLAHFAFSIRKPA